MDMKKYNYLAQLAFFLFFSVVSVAENNLVNVGKLEKIILDKYKVLLTNNYKQQDSASGDFFTDGFTFLRFTRLEDDYSHYLDFLKFSEDQYVDMFKDVRFKWIAKNEFNVPGLKGNDYILRETSINQGNQGLLVLELVIRCDGGGIVIGEARITGFDDRIETFLDRVEQAKQILQSISQLNATTTITWHGTPTLRKPSMTRVASSPKYAMPTARPGGPARPTMSMAR